MSNGRRIGGLRIVLPLLSLMVGCAGNTTTDAGSAEEPVRSPEDPWEPLNRGMYVVHDTLDRYTLRLVARGYRAVIPDFARRGVTNFSRNLLTPRSMVNNFLQGKPGPGFNELGRFIINSTLGIGGLIDLATLQGMPVYDEDFSQTLAVWGVPEGPFVFIPILGPNTLLEAVTIPIDLASDLLYHYNNTSVRDKIYVLRAIDVRARLLTAETLLEDSQDSYLTLRESYLQNRRFQVHDGDPPTTQEEDDLFDEFFEEE
jgi:phospholipid-binding lipoprotein MlaA